MSAVSVSEYVASLNKEQQRHINAFIEFMDTEYPQLTNKISFSMPMWLVGKKMNEGYVAVSAAKTISPSIFPMRSLSITWLNSCLPASEESSASTSNTVTNRHSRS